jgi:hypothetical protein
MRGGGYSSGFHSHAGALVLLTPTHANHSLPLLTGPLYLLCSPCHALLAPPPPPPPPPLPPRAANRALRTPQRRTRTARRSTCGGGATCPSGTPSSSTTSKQGATSPSKAWAKKKKDRALGNNTKQHPRERPLAPPSPPNHAASALCFVVHTFVMCLLQGTSC